MRYASNEDLSPTVRGILPTDAQDLYRETYNQAWDDYDEASQEDMSRHDMAHRQAWMAVERAFVRDPNSGIWRARGQTAEEAKEEGTTLLGRVKDLIGNAFA
jgi:cation transport regulator